MNLISVSYTHLDVYKRQTLDNTDVHWNNMETAILQAVQDKLGYKASTRHNGWFGRDCESLKKETRPGKMLQWEKQDLLEAIKAKEEQQQLNAEGKMQIQK